MMLIKTLKSYIAKTTCVTFHFDGFIPEVIQVKVRVHFTASSRLRNKQSAERLFVHD